jgi:hypothetical protein
VPTAHHGKRANRHGTPARHEPGMHSMATSDSVPDEEWSACVERIKKARDAANRRCPPGKSLNCGLIFANSQPMWPSKLSNERKNLALMEIKPNIPPNWIGWHVRQRRTIPSVPLS